jgi:hypothetical protein
MTAPLGSPEHRAACEKELAELQEANSRETEWGAAYAEREARIRGLQHYLGTPPTLEGTVCL